MLTYEEAKKIGINACIDRIGREYCKQYRDYSCSGSGDVDEYAYCFACVNDHETEMQGLCLDGGDEDWQYFVSCKVWYTDGRIEFIECRVPDGNVTE